MEVFSSHCLFVVVFVFVCVCVFFFFFGGGGGKRLEAKRLICRYHFCVAASTRKQKLVNNNNILY